MLHWSPLHHALDANYSWRSNKAVLGLLPITSLETINTPTRHGLHKPEGYTALHFACDGSDRTLHGAQIAADLIEMKADIDAQTKKGKTAFLLAAGTGLGSHMEVLLHGGCNKKAQAEDNGKGASREDGRVGQFELTANTYLFSCPAGSPATVPGFVTVWWELCTSRFGPRCL